MSEPPEMVTDQLHDLAAAYALDALGEDDRRAFDAHLTGCARCREEVAALAAAAGALAYVPDSAAPSAGLRSRILDAAREEGPSNVVPLRSRRRWLVPAASVAAVAAAAALAIGVWQAVDSGGGSSRLAYSLEVGAGGAARLTVDGLDAAPDGKIYEVWVIDPGVRPAPAGTFSGGGATVVSLKRAVHRGAAVAVTLERYPGTDSPTPPILLQATA